jgi:predicted ATPase
MHRHGDLDDLIVEIGDGWKGMRLQVGRPLSTGGSPRPILREFRDHEWLTVSELGKDTLGALSPYSKSVLLRLDPRALSSPSYSIEKIPNIDGSGYGLASVLDYLQNMSSNRFELIMESLREIVPSVRAVRCTREIIRRMESETIRIGEETIHRTLPREYSGQGIEFETSSASAVPAASVSEGTILVLGLLTVILSPDQPRIILLDDLDRALHPLAQQRLIGELRRLQRQFQDVQVVATSHSPYLLNSLMPEEVYVTNLDKRGMASVRRLNEHPDFSRWSAEMTPGEFWSVVGENWVGEEVAGASS